MCQRPLPTSLNLARTAIPLVLPVPAVVLPVATEDARNTAVGVGALELAGQADVDVWEREEERGDSGLADAAMSLVGDGWAAVPSPEM